MPAAPKQFQVRYKDGTIRAVLAHSVRGAAKKFVLAFAVNPGDEFRVRERLGPVGWECFVRTKKGIRSLGTID